MDLHFKGAHRDSSSATRQQLTRPELLRFSAIAEKSTAPTPRHQSIHHAAVVQPRPLSLLLLSLSPARTSRFTRRPAFFVSVHTRMKAPHTPTRGGSKGAPRTPSVNRLAVAERSVGARVERGEAAPVEAPFAQSARAWRSGGDRKIMFDNRGEGREQSQQVCRVYVCPRKRKNRAVGIQQQQQQQQRLQRG